MTEFQTTLERTLQSVSKAFALADADLHHEVVSASQAVQNVTGGRARLELVPQQESDRGFEYALVLNAGGEDTPLLHFTVPLEGYPIRTEDGELQNREEVARAFASMASRPSSPLVKKLTFLLLNP
jgi:hypothetical protein